MGRRRAGRGSTPTSMRPRRSSISRRRPMARSRSRHGRRSARLPAAITRISREPREDEKIRFRDISGAAAQDHLLADVVGHRERARQLQCRLHQCPRADPLAHADRSSAILPGPSVDPRFRRRLRSLPAAGRYPHDRAMLGKRSNGETEIVLNFITPHQKWGIHSTYTDNLLMLTLSRGGPIVWIIGDGREEGRHRRQRLDRALQRERRDRRTRRRQPARAGQACA